MLCRTSANFIRLRHLYKANQYSTNSVLHESQKFKLPDSILPNVNFLQTLDQWRQGKVARMLVELEALYAIVDEVPKKLTDAHWEYMLSNTYQIYDRQEYLRQLYFNEKNMEITRENNERRKLLLKEQTERFARGEIVYARGFNELYSLHGQDFRRLIDCYYSNKLLLKEKFDDGFPEMFVDCRYLHKLNQTWLQRTLNDFQKLHVKNWTDFDPVKITFSNYLADTRVAQVARSSLKFLYGPQAKNSMEAADENIEQIGDLFENHEQDESELQLSPFYPRMTNRDFCSILPSNVQKDEIAYVTSIGQTPLNENVLNRSKIFIVQAFPEHALQKNFHLSLMKSLENEKIKTYRLPFDSHIKCIGGHKAIPASATTSILRDMLSKKFSWTDAMMNHVSKSQFAAPDDPTAKSKLDELKLFLNDSWIASSKQKTLSETYSRVKPKESEPRVRVHKYSREERNKMRKAAIG